MVPVDCRSGSDDRVLTFRLSDQGQVPGLTTWSTAECFVLLSYLMVNR